MPTEYPACREADSAGSNFGAEAPRIEPVSRSASEPDSASLNKVRAANLPEELKPDTRREAIFTNSGGVLRGERGQRAGKVGLGRLGGPCHRPREEPGKTRTESIRRVLGVGESERPVVAMKLGNARGAKGPWPCGTNSEAEVADWRNPITAYALRAESAVASGSQIVEGGELPGFKCMAKAGCGKSARPV